MRNHAVGDLGQRVQKKRGPHYGGKGEKDEGRGGWCENKKRENVGEARVAKRLPGGVGGPSGPPKEGKRAQLREGCRTKTGGDLKRKGAAKKLLRGS